MSAELRNELDKVAEEECKRTERRLEQDLPRIKSLILKIAALKELDLRTWVQGTRQRESTQDEKDLDALEKAGLVTGETKYTHRNVYRQYKLTDKGIELAEKIAAENNRSNLT